MKTKCQWCGTEFESVRVDGKWCAMECKQRGGQLQALERMRERAKANPKAFHEGIRTRWMEKR